MINSLPLNHLVEIMRTSSCVRQNFFGDKSDNTSNILKSFDEFIAKTKSIQIELYSPWFYCSEIKRILSKWTHRSLKIFYFAQCVCV